MPHSLIDYAFVGFLAAVQNFFIAVFYNALGLGVLLTIIAASIAGLLGFSATVLWGRRRLPAPKLDVRDDFPRRTTRKVKCAD